MMHLSTECSILQIRRLTSLKNHRSHDSLFDIQNPLQKTEFIRLWLIPLQSPSHEENHYHKMTSEIRKNIKPRKHDILDALESSAVLKKSVASIFNGLKRAYRGSFVQKLS